MARPADRSDSVDRIIEQWQRERPDLDASAKGITGRVVRVAELFQQAFRAGFDPLGLSEGEYGILAALRRAGEPFRLTPTELAAHQMMTSGGMTAAVDRLEAKGLVQRTPNPADRRGTFVGLTATGRELIDEAMAVHVGIEHDLVGSLDAADRRRLEQALRTLVLALDPAGHT